MLKFKNLARASPDRLDRKTSNKQRIRHDHNRTDLFQFPFTKIDTGVPLCPGDKRDRHKAHDIEDSILAGDHRSLDLREILVEERPLSKLLVSSNGNGKRNHAFTYSPNSDTRLFTLVSDPRKRCSFYFDDYHKLLLNSIGAIHFPELYNA